MMDVEEKLADMSLKEEADSRDNDVSSTTKPKANAIRTTSTESESDDGQAKERFMRLVTKARQLTDQGDIAGAIKLNEKALEIRYSDKLQRRIEKMKAFLADQEESDVEDEGGDGQMKVLGDGFMLHRRLYEKLYTHQKEGVLWMWSLFVKGKGGILADDMGLGKTIQVIAFLAGLFDMQKIKTVMIVVPLSVMPNWLTEFGNWTPGINVTYFHGTSKKEREKALSRVRGRGGVLMTTYGLVITAKETFASRHGREFVWDYVILDEGHKIKNPTKTSKSVHMIPAKHRIILTGTPVQNNLKELWSLFDYVHQGTLLGTMRTFKMEFETPIIRARERDATSVERRLGQEMAETLKAIIKPYFLRRTKAQVSDDKENSSETKDSKDLKMPTMTRKNDLVIWLHLTETQQKIYQDFINLDHVKELLMTKKSPLVALTVLKKICDHPRLLSTRACLQLGLDGDDFDEEELEQPESYESAVTQVDKIPDEILVGESGKMQILVNLLDNFKSEGHRTLVFSQSRKLLNIIQKVITGRGHKVTRLDGTITQLTERDEIVKKFQSDTSYSVFLLTVQVGGVGLTITAADRVIIYDPNWNPATDAQAVDRVYRIGQQKNVVVYRLITCGTVEEKIYRRQVFKDSITRQTTSNSKNPYRYFTKMELRELFSLDDPHFSKTQRQLQELHGNQRQSDTVLDEHIAYLHSLDIFGISDHDLMFRQIHIRDDEEEDAVQIGEEEAQNNARLIQNRVQQAQALIANETTAPISYEERSKGAMRYPSSTATTFTVSGGPNRAGPSNNIPRPSPLFSEVSSSHTIADESVEEEENAENSVGAEAQNSSSDVIDLTSPVVRVPKEDMVDEKKPFPKLEVMSPIRNPLPEKEKERRALQPLSPAEVQRRSPFFTPGATRKTFKEEILISPDNRSPIVGLEKVQARYSKLQGASPRNSPTSSPRKQAPQSPQSLKPRNIFSSPKSAASPSRSENLSEKFDCQNIGATSDETFAKKDIFGFTGFPSDAASTPRASHSVADTEILVEESPDHSMKTVDSSSKNSSSSAMSCHYSSFQATPDHARRKLSFVVADSVNNSPAESSQPGNNMSFERVDCPTAEKKLRTHAMSQLLSSSELPQDENIEDENFEGFDDEDKENCPGEMKMDDDDSEGNSVSDDMEEYDDDEDVQYDDNEEEEEDNAEDGDERELVTGDNQDSRAVVDDDDAAEEEEGEDAEQNARFQKCIVDAKALYRNKEYKESLRYVEEALRIFKVPQLEDMRDKILSKIDQ